MVALLKMPSRLSFDEKLERRMFPRREIHTCAEGHRLDHSTVARRQPHLSLNLRDVSAGGLSALADTPLLRGEHISVSIPGTYPGMGWNAMGRVIRCEPSGMGYRVAVEFDSLPAAA
jgi:hypothetical protein